MKFESAILISRNNPFMHSTCAEFQQIHLHCPRAPSSLRNWRRSNFANFKKSDSSPLNAQIFFGTFSHLLGTTNWFLPSTWSQRFHTGNTPNWYRFHDRWKWVEIWPLTHVHSGAPARSQLDSSKMLWNIVTRSWIHDMFPGCLRLFQHENFFKWKWSKFLLYHARARGYMWPEDSEAIAPDPGGRSE